MLSEIAISKAALASIVVCFLLLFALYLAPGFARSRTWLEKRVRRCIPIFLLPYLIYCAGTGDFRWLAFLKLVALAAVPFGVFALAPVKSPQRMNWQDAVALLWLMLPVLFGWLRGIWNVPMNLDFMARLFLVAVGAWSFLILRGVKDAGYEFRFSPAILRDAAVSLAGFSAIGLPLGLAIGFIGWNPQWKGWPRFAFDFVTIFVFVALAEELFFRGLVQNLLEGSLGSRYVAQGVTSVLFGFSHIQHAPFPNWRYVALATVAGWFYGSAYRKQRSLMASATTHAMVDTIWRTWLTLPRL